MLDHDLSRILAQYLHRYQRQFYLWDCSIVNNDIGLHQPMSIYKHLPNFTWSALYSSDNLASTASKLRHATDQLAYIMTIQYLGGSSSTFVIFGAFLRCTCFRNLSSVNSSIFVGPWYHGCGKSVEIATCCIVISNAKSISLSFPGSSHIHPTM